MTDLTDAARRIVERLRNDVCLTSHLDWQEHVALANEAADRIASLQAENERLREALPFFRSVIQCGEDWTETCEKVYRAALNTKGGERTGRCENRKRPGGCQLHNLQCGYPECDRYPADAANEERTSDE